MSLSLYIHIPFCKSKCFYCVFTSFEKKEACIYPYLSVLKKEAINYKGSRVNTVYIGGGTPTYLDVKQIQELFSILHTNFVIEKDAEVTVEANPATFDLKKAKTLYDLGVNRLSLGVQSLDDKNLKYLGRPYCAKDVLSAFKILRQAGFSNINLDLIYGLPGQTKSEIKSDVKKLTFLGSEHLSLYSLTVSLGSQFHKSGIKPIAPEKQADFFELISRLLLDAGFKHYEVSNFSKFGYECRHNLNYWQGGDYIGLGVSAHSHFKGHRFWNDSGLGSYIQSINKKACAKAGEEKLENPKRLLETFLIGLRMTKGVQLGELETRFQSKLSDDKKELINEFVQHGLLLKDKEHIRTTMSGMLVLDEICARLI